jgi:hypothetical protein
MQNKKVVENLYTKKLISNLSLNYHLPGILLVVFLLSFSSLKAQDSLVLKRDNSVTFGLQLGLAFTHFTGWALNGSNPTGENLVRFRGGGNIDIPLKQGISLRPELLLSWKGYKAQQDSITYKTDLMYVNVPVDVVFKVLSMSHTPNHKADLNLGAGLYFGYALHGKFQQDSSKAAVNFNNHGVPSTVTDYATYYKRYDGGLNFFVEFTGFSFYSQVGASFGLVNIKPPIQNSSAKQANYKNSSIYLTWGWRF